MQAAMVWLRYIDLGEESSMNPENTHARSFDVHIMST